MKTFDVDKITPQAFQTKLVKDITDKITDINGTPKPKSIMMIQETIVPITNADGSVSATQGFSIRNSLRPLVTINSLAVDQSHTMGHEILHRFLIFSKLNPTTKSEHKKQGGLFTYGSVNNSTGIISGTGPISQQNVNLILKEVPQVKDRFNDITDYDESTFKTKSND